MLWHCHSEARLHKWKPTRTINHVHSHNVNLPDKHARLTANANTPVPMPPCKQPPSTSEFDLPNFMAYYYYSSCHRCGCYSDTGSSTVSVGPLAGTHNGGNITCEIASRGMALRPPTDTHSGDNTILETHCVVAPTAKVSESNPRRACACDCNRCANCSGTCGRTPSGETCQMFHFGQRTSRALHCYDGLLVSGVRPLHAPHARLEPVFKAFAIPPPHLAR